MQYAFGKEMTRKQKKKQLVQSKNTLQYLKPASINNISNRNIKKQGKSQRYPKEASKRKTSDNILPKVQTEKIQEKTIYKSFQEVYNRLEVYKLRPNSCTRCKFSMYMK